MLSHFTTYDGELPNLSGFVDESYKNDACPSMFNASRALKLWVDYVDPSRRECSGMRYTLCAYNQDQDDYTFLFATDSLNELKTYLEA